MDFGRDINKLAAIVTPKMTFEIRLVNTSKTIISSMILIIAYMILISSSALGSNVSVVIITGYLIMLGSIIFSAIINSSKKVVEITQDTILIDNSLILINQIEYCRTGKSFLIDGLMIRMKNRKTYYFHALTFLFDNSNFQLFKEALRDKSITTYKFPIKTKQDFLRESKFLRYGSSVLLITFFGLLILSYFTHSKIGHIQLLYWSMITLGFFISTRK